MSWLDTPTRRRDYALRPLREGAIFAGEFRVLRVLGEGGMGAVYVAEQLGTGKLRALKTMHAQLVGSAELRERFIQEARIGARIDSEHIVDVVAAGIDAATGMPWLAMELLQGETLADAVLRGGLSTTSPRGAAGALLQLGDAIASAHAAGVVHRDLKPENLFLARTKHQDVPFVLKVLDFGIAKLVMRGAATATASVGTPMWMAPEQTELGASITPATDVWSFGLIAFFVLTGQTYWRLAVDGHEVSGPVLLRQIVLDPLPAATARARELGCRAALPAGFDGWFARCVARARSDRFADGAAALAALHVVLAGPIPCGGHTQPLVVAQVAAQVPSTTRALTEGGVSNTAPAGVPSPSHARGVARAAMAGAVLAGTLAVVGLVGARVAASRGAHERAVAMQPAPASSAAPSASARTRPDSPAEGRTFASAPVELRWSHEGEPAEHEVEVARASEPAIAQHFPAGVSYALWPWNGEALPGSYAWRVRESGGSFSPWSRFTYYPSILDRISETRKLRVAMETTYHAPFVYYDVATKRVVGFDVELAEAIATSLGVTMERQSREWAQLFRDVESRDVDLVISAVTITPERSRKAAFSDPYLQTGVVITTRASTEKLAAPGAGKTLAAQRGTTAAAAGAKIFTKATLRELDTLDGAFAALAHGEVDGLLSDESVIVSRPEVLAGGYRVHPTRLTRDGYGVMLPSGDDRLRTRVNAVLRQLESAGKLAELRARYGLAPLLLVPGR